MHPSKVTLSPKVRRPMAWDSTKSAPSAQQPEPSTKCPIPGGYRRAETRPHRGRYSTRFVKRITEEEVSKYILVFELREKLIARLAIFEGLRPGEILALRWRA